MNSPIQSEKKLSPSSESSHQRDLLTILSAQAVRERSQQLYLLGIQGKLNHLSVHLEHLDDAASATIEAIEQNYPDLKIPFHSRLRHLMALGKDRTPLLTQAIAEEKKEAKSLGSHIKNQTHPFIRQDLKAWTEWVIISVLLDAGAGHQWGYEDPRFGGRISRSEGLCIASVYMYLSGLFSLNPKKPLRIHGEKLLKLTLKDLERAFQADAQSNPLTGLDGRLEVLHRLGQLILDTKGFRSHFSESEDHDPAFRLGDILDLLLPLGTEQEIHGGQLLATILNALGPIWPGRLTLHGVNLGDTWKHPLVSCPGPTDQLIPFHKLSQWLTYSLLDIFQLNGFQIVGLEELTGLPEYRNGGLLLDCKVLQFKDPRAYTSLHQPSSELVVEWRALTVTLLDQLADRIRTRLSLDQKALPLVKILEGGTWAAGRMMAHRLRPQGLPPLQLVSDGTVF